jgi:hypothetical protein
MKYDEDVLLAIASLNKILINKMLWPEEKRDIESVLLILDKYRKA